MITNLAPEVQLTVLSYINQSNTKDTLQCRLVCNQWDEWCIELLQANGITVSLTSKRQSKQFLQLLKKNTKLNSTVHHLVVRSKIYYEDFIPIICHCPALKSLDLGGSNEFYFKFYELIIQLEKTPRMKDLPSIEEFKFNDKKEEYGMGALFLSSVINERVTAFRHSVKHQHVILDSIDIPRLYKGDYELKDGLTEMSRLEKVTALYVDDFPVNVFIEDVLNSKLKRLKTLKILGIGMNMTSRLTHRINPVFTLRELEIVLPGMDVNVLRYIMKSSPNLENLCVLSDKSDYLECMTIVGDNPFQTFTSIITFSKYCKRIPTVVVSLVDNFFTVCSQVHREAGKKIDFIWDLFEQNEEFYILSSLFN